MASKPWKLRPNIVLVEGVTDEALFNRADQLAREAGRVLLGDEIAFVASGRRDQGGTFGVARELITLRSMIPLVLNAQGYPAYRAIGLVDNDHAGRRIIEDVVRTDRGSAEFVDIVALRPVMPRFTRIDPRGRRRQCDAVNGPHFDLDWEIEDVVSPRLMTLFEQMHPLEIVDRISLGGKTHYELTRFGKATFHRLVQHEATLDDLLGVVEVVRTVRSMIGLADVAA